MINLDNNKFSSSHRGFNKADNLLHNEQQLLLSLLSDFKYAEIDSYKEIVEEVLRKVGLYCKADRLYIYAYDSERGIAYLNYQWCADGISEITSKRDSVWLKSIKPLVNCLQKGTAVYLPSLAAVDSKDDFIIFPNKQDVKSMALFPFNADEIHQGFIGVDFIKKDVSLTNWEILILKSLAELIAIKEIRFKKEKELLDLTNKHIDLVEQTNDWIWEVDQHGYFTYVNKYMETLTGFKASELLGNSPFSFMEKEEAERIERSFKEALKNGQPLEQLENVFKHKNGHNIYLETSGMPIYNQAGNVKGFRGISRNITAKYEKLEKMKYLSMHDSLTGLYNRAYFEEELKRLQYSREYPITMIYIDVNNLKAINDTIGHLEGDNLLKIAAQILKSVTRHSEILARVGGDEFIIVLPNNYEESGQKIVSRIRNKVSQYNADNNVAYLSFSIGTATALTDDTSLIDLMKAADDAMYRDKMINGKNSNLMINDMLIKNHLENSYLGIINSQSLARICLDLGKFLNLNTEQLKNLDLLVKAHNLGKAGISKEILYKKGRLSKEEQNIIYLHPEKGYRIALSSPELASIADLILKHHERWDGKGYPLGLKGDSIPIECRILAVADAYSAMTEGRAYKPACSSEKALEELKICSGSQFDPQVVEAFCYLYEQSMLNNHDRQDQA